MQTTPFNNVLIANRGEIACRVIRTAKKLGFKTVAVYSDADRRAPHVLMADKAIHIGASSASASYLDSQKIIAAAKSSGAQAIHPGYGFLSENAEFSDACKEAGLVFIGPSAEAIDVMGNKAESKRRMIAAGVPCVPGYQGQDQSDSVLLEQAKAIGVPIMVKAAAGGGGRGMRLVEDLTELGNAIKLARSEAENAFGSGELILEKAIIEPRHVEVQVFADRAGNTVYLGERDCSVQRRHQKVVEEAPCPIMTEELRAKMGEAAVAAAQSINYEGAGTVEFLLDATGEFYFLEMNTRLQVEHPVTELITGLDLVELQLQVAQGQNLGFAQADVSLDGHAIEVRLYTEDPAQDFLPNTGLVSLWNPAHGDGVRIDDGISTGQEISPFYDPMVAKIIGYGASREIARNRLIKALQNTMLIGVKHNKSFLIDCLKKQSFIDGQATTAFIQQEFNEESLKEKLPTMSQMATAAVLDCITRQKIAATKSLGISPDLVNWSSDSSAATMLNYSFDDAQTTLSVSPQSSTRYRIGLEQGEKSTEVLVQIEQLSEHQCVALIDGGRQELGYFIDQVGDIWVNFAGSECQFIDQIQLAGSIDDIAGGGNVVAPMHGMVLEVHVEVGQEVEKGDALLILEAMKMQHQILAEVDGKVSEVFTSSGSQVSTDDALITIEAEE